MSQQQVRTTIYLDENLYLQAKRKALEERSTLTELIKRGLQNQLAEKKYPKKKTNHLRLGNYNLGIKQKYQKLRRVDIYEDPQF